MILTIALGAVLAAFAAGVMRVVRGPTIADRAMALDLCMFALVGVFALLSIRAGTSVFLDAVVVTTLLGFVGTISLAKLAGRRR